ncbi:MAG: hypothetical protein HGB18_03500 [Candidatus Moranbacteria bacterium]|nr:hypothetical protein [Candidatus Moranbacteria bacterium]
MIRTNKYPVPNLIRPSHVLVSVFDKTGLEVLVEAVLRANPQAMFYSTGGTETKLLKILGSRAGTNYMSVETFTGCPEMEGGLVKTLHPKIHAGLLAERGNPNHERYLSEDMAQFGQGPGVYFDIFVGGLYPFDKVVQEEGSTAETARCNIDIGGPTMTMAAAKNWHSVAVLTQVEQYEELARKLAANGGFISAASRFRLAVEAISVVSDFRFGNWAYFSHLDFQRDVLPTIELVP